MTKHAGDAVTRVKGRRASESVAVATTGAASSHAAPRSVDSGEAAADAGGAGCTERNIGITNSGRFVGAVEPMRAHGVDGTAGSG